MVSGTLVPDIKTGLAYRIYQCNRAAVTAGNPFSGLRMDNKGWWSVTSVKWGGTVMSGNIQGLEINRMCVHVITCMIQYNE